MNNVKKNFFYLSVYKVFEMLLPLITSPLLSRKLGAEALGEYTYIYSVVSIFIIFAELGVYRYGMREIAKVRNSQQLLERTYTEVYLTHFINGIGILIFYLIFINQYLDMPLYEIYLIQAGFIIANMFDNSFFYVGIENIKTVTVRDALVKIVTFVIILLFINEPNDLKNYVLCMVLSSIIAKLISLVYAKKYCKFVRVEISACFQHLKPMFVLMIPALASVIYQSMDRIMIGKYYNATNVGYYECASKVLIPKYIITSLGTVMCPGIAKLYGEKNYEEINNKVISSLKLCLLLSYAIMFGICSISKEFAPLFWGESFSVCSNMMIGLSLTIPIWCVGEVIRNQYLLPCAKDNEYMLAFIIGVITNAIINYILIPSYGVLGAMIGTLMAEFTMSFIQAWYIRKTINCLNAIFYTIPYFCFGLIMFISIRLLNNVLMFNDIINIIIEVIVGIFIFVFFTLMYELNTKHFLLIRLLKK